MRTSPFNDTDVLSGLAFTAAGAVAVYVSLDYEFGAVTRMGPGFFPRVLGLILVGLGLFIAARGRLRAPNRVDLGRVRPFFMICAALVAFGWLVPRFGLAPAVVVCCILSMLAAPRTSLREALLLSLLLALFCSLVFVTGLGLTIPVARWW